MAELDPPLVKSESFVPRWRAVRRWWPTPWGWGFWGLTFWNSLVLVRYASELEFLTFPLAIVASIALFAAAYLLYRAVVAPLVARRRSAVDVPPPPPRAEADATFLVPPQPVYPAVELLRGQCGWIHLRLRVDVQGRVRAYQVIDQAPRKVFQAAIAHSLQAARLPPGTSGEVSSVVTFVTPGANTPDWAAGRLNPVPSDC